MAGFHRRGGFEAIMKFRYLFPVLYIIASMFALIVLGGAGHGHGPEIFYYLSLPACLVVNVSDTGIAWIFCVLVSIMQYALFGYLLDRLLRWTRRETK